MAAKPIERFVKRRRQPNGTVVTLVRGPQSRYDRELDRRCKLLDHPLEWPWVDVRTLQRILEPTGRLTDGFGRELSPPSR